MRGALWTPRQIQLLKSNPTLPVNDLRPLLEMVGPPHTRGAIHTKRCDLLNGQRRAKWTEARRAKVQAKLKGRPSPRKKAAPPVSPMTADGWPRTPPPEEASEIFRVALLKAMLAEVRGRAVAA